MLTYINRFLFEHFWVITIHKIFQDQAICVVSIIIMYGIHVRKTNKAAAIFVLSKFLSKYS